MATKAQVIDLHLAHPDWPAGRIARELGCGQEYVRKTAARNSLSLPRAVQGPRTPEQFRQAATALLRRAAELEAAADGGRGKRA